MLGTGWVYDPRISRFNVKMSGMKAEHGNTDTVISKRFISQTELCISRSVLHAHSNGVATALVLVVVVL